MYEKAIRWIWGVHPIPDEFKTLWIDDEFTAAVGSGNVLLRRRARMLIVHIQVHVKTDCLEIFRAATIENARESVKEPGIARFDVVQQTDDPTRFVLVEVYRTADAPAKHRETAHYVKWRDIVASMMAEARTRVEYREVFWTA
jgi:(4S)-4-hydroxy-5-phosphonooxypentane-2,3-dione isomerase